MISHGGICVRGLPTILSTWFMESSPVKCQLTIHMRVSTNRPSRAESQEGLAWKDICVLGPGPGYRQKVSRRNNSQNK